VSKIVITGVGGLVGSAAAEYFHALGYSIVGVDNDSRGVLLNDPDASTLWSIERLRRELPRFYNYAFDVRRRSEVQAVLKATRDVTAIIHTAAQTAHEGSLWEDFNTNVVGTLNMLEAWKVYAPQAVFIHMSTIKVYGDYPNTLNYVQLPTRCDLDEGHRYYNGFDESVPIDQGGTSSFFGRSKTAADLYVQEFTSQFGLKAACLRASCITGGSHSAVEAHGMLGYMMRCAYEQIPYRVYGYQGLQVRDQIHATDLVTAMHEFIKAPTSRVVYNIGGGRGNSCSMLEAIAACERLTGNRMQVSFHPMRTGDHQLWVTDNTAFEDAYPNWKIKMSLEAILEEILEQGRGRWNASMELV